MLLTLNEIHAYYGIVPALIGVSIEINQGEIVALLGANGAGKTTLLLTISGIIRAKRGQVLFQGQPITRKKPSAIVELGIAHCPEGRALFPNMTVQDNLSMGAFLRKNRSGITNDLKTVYQHFPVLLARKRQAAGSLSGGEQQMLAIGRALMSRPTLLMLDEPSLGLAPLLVVEILQIIKTINQEGTSVLLVEQNAVGALEVADRGYVLGNGKILYAGTRQELIDNDRVRRAYLGG